uniref:Uncharacterized protein n=1 Tax=Nelumbo nucifera TaxID=4432 RepID=A0A822YD34_NELNU|nr:TPA_asm: hypothetical protein HUJ06_030677 [Nelumbo nucifera]
MRTPCSGGCDLKYHGPPKMLHAPCEGPIPSGAILHTLICPGFHMLHTKALFQQVRSYIPWSTQNAAWSMRRPCFGKCDPTYPSPPIMPHAPCEGPILVGALLHTLVCPGCCMIHAKALFGQVRSYIPWSAQDAVYSM